MLGDTLLEEGVTINNILLLGLVGLIIIETAPVACLVGAGSIICASAKFILGYEK